MGETVQLVIEADRQLAGTGGDHTDVQLRVFQAGSQGYGVVPYPAPGSPVSLQLELRGAFVPRMVLWAVARERAPGGRVVFQTLGIGIVPLKTGQYIISLDDPSQRDSGTELYKQQGTVRVAVVYTGTMTPDAEEFDAYMDSLMARAFAERQERFEVFQQDLAPSAIVPAARPIYLRTFTTTNGIVPASYFATVSEDDQPPDPVFIHSLWKSAAAIHGSTWQDIEANIAALFGTPTTGGTSGTASGTGSTSGLSDADLYRTLTVFGEVLTSVGTACWYNGDHHADTPVERFAFGTAQRLQQCDCEDCAQDIFAFATRARLLDPEDHPDIRGFLRLLRQYEYLMITGVATTPSLQRHRGKEAGGNPRDYICHVWSMGIPRLAMQRMTGEDRFTAGLTNNTVAKRLAAWGALVLEGTNFTTVLYRPITFYVKDDPREATRIARELRETMAFRIQWEKEIPSLRELSYTLMPPLLLKRAEPGDLGAQSNFYRWAMSAWVAGSDDPNAAIEYVLRQPDGTVGVTMQQLIELDRVVLESNGPPALDSLERQVVLSGQPPRVPFKALGTLGGADAMWRGLGFAEPPRGTLTYRVIQFRFQHVGEISGRVLVGLKRLAVHAHVAGGLLHIMRITEELQIIEIHVHVKPSAAVSDVLAVAMMGSDQ